VPSRRRRPSARPVWHSGKAGSAPPSTPKPCAARYATPSASRKSWDWMSWYTGRPSATIWSSILQNSWRATPYPLRLGTELRLALRQAGHHCRRPEPSPAHDGGLDKLCPEPDPTGDEGHAHRPGNHADVVLP